MKNSEDISRSQGSCAMLCGRAGFNLGIFLISMMLMAAAFALKSAPVWAETCQINGATNQTVTVNTPLNTMTISSSTNYPGNYDYIWTVTWDDGSAPAGVSANTCSGGTSKVSCAQMTISGTPSAIGSYGYTVTVSDGSKCDANTAGVRGMITVNPASSAQITTLSLPNGKEGVAYSKQMLAECNDGTGTVIPCTGAVWSKSGVWPSGLSIDALTGLISGTPASGSAGTYNNVVVTLNFGGSNASQSYSLIIAPATQPLSILTNGLATGTVSMSYTYTLEGIGGTPPYSWSASGLPAGLTCSPAGVISGTPTSAGDSSVTIILSDSVGSVSKILTLHVNAAPAPAAAAMTNYCVTPPFVPQEILPNLLLEIDNSASMYDLYYIDKGSITRNAYYCYDQTYRRDGPYTGYFDNSTVYSYNFSTRRFEPAIFPAICAWNVPSTLCIQGSSSAPKSVTGFYATGHYLNWLTSSKFDIEKMILTGGKYDAGGRELVSESRGCVGRSYLKEALTADYVEGGMNTSLGVVFGVRGPVDADNPTAPSPGGQTWIDIYFGDYGENVCQNAIDLYQDPACNQECRRNATSACIAYNSQGQDLISKMKNVFIQSVQECWQYDTMAAPKTVGGDAVNTVKNQCPAIYDGHSPGKCSFSTNITCTIDANCPAGEKCIAGPLDIMQGDAALLCSSQFAGACYVGAPPYSKQNFTGSVVANDGTTKTGDDCIIYQHNKYCGAFGFPPVTDPTDDTSATQNFQNVPAILGDVGVEGQLGPPVESLRVRAQANNPSGVLQEFSDIVRFGVMSFNFAGSAAECEHGGSTDVLRCPRVCSNDPSKSCTTYIDCPASFPAPRCEVVTTNRDASQIKLGGYLGDPLGDHNGGIIRALDEIRADSWTPLSEGLYTAVAYYSQNTSDSNRPRRLDSGDFSTTKNPIVSPCQDNNILILSDGMSTADQRSDVLTFVSNNHVTGGQTTTSLAASGSVLPLYYGSVNLDDLAWYAHTKNIFDPTQPVGKPKDTIDTYVIYSGTECAAKDGSGQCTTTDEKVSEKLMQLTASEGGGLYYLAADPETMYDSLRDALIKIAAKGSSGTAASVLASGEGSGANLIQAVFYPTRKFGQTNIRWTGRLTNLWYYVDPFFATSAIYEDTTADKRLNLTNDYRITRFYYDENTKKTMAERIRDTDNNGVPDDIVNPDIEFENLSGLWEAGSILWGRTTSRRIKTTTGSGLMDFSTANASTLRPYLQAANNTEAADVISYIRGDSDPAGFRPRTVTIGSDTHIWKLGDIVQSTPRVASGIRLNFYDLVYNDSSYKNYLDTTADRGMVFAGANDGMLHAFKLGRLTQTPSGFEKAQLLNPDGTTPLGHEVWAFIPKNVLPYLKYIGDPQYCHLYSVDLSPYIFDASIGTTDCTETNYWNCSKYDAAAVATPKKRWRTILIGGMRFGGACRNSTGMKAGDTSVCTDCVKAPGVDLNGDSSISGTPETTLGLTEYFALDITDTLDDPSQDPALLWEFSSDDLGFSSSGASVVRISARRDPSDPASDADRSKNGRWFVVIGSGPTGPISTADHQFMGRSDQDLGVFIFDLKRGPVSGNYWTIDTGISNGFAGSMLNQTDDVTGTSGKNYEDDVVYVPYVRKCGALETCSGWKNGGVGRLRTKESLDPGEWAWSKVIDGVGPVTSATVRLFDTRRQNQWIYFGTGRYFFEQDSPDDPSGQRGIFGVKDPCYDGSTGKFEETCPATPLATSDLTDVTDVADVPATAEAIAAMKGWVVNLDLCSNDSEEAEDCSTARWRSERVITDPLAITAGAVFFTTFKPKSDSCNPAGKSYLWATKYDTGGSAGAILKGKAILQVSTGSIEQIDLAQSFEEGPDGGNTHRGKRRSSAMDGVPPVAQGLSILTSPPPVKRTMHIRER